MNPRLAGVPRAFTTRRIPDEWLNRLILEGTPCAGDLVLARVESVGQHGKLHLPNARRRQLFEGDEILVAFGNRYASDQFEAEVPASLGPCHLAAGGGMASQVLSQHRDMRRPTVIQPLGFIGRDSGDRPVNLSDAALEALPQPVPGTIPTLAVVGTSMNSGKTTTAASLARGLVRAGYRVGYVKATGTSASCDPTLLEDAGAMITLDCVDAGFISTYRVDVPTLERACLNLLSHAARSGVDVILVEVADGVLQQETAGLLEGDMARQHFDALLFTAADAMGATLGCQWLAHRGHRVLGVAGTISNSPLQMGEARAATGVPVHRTCDLAVAATAAELLQQLTNSR